MRIKEWFAWHFPELNQLVPDNMTFAKVVNLIEVNIYKYNNNPEQSRDRLKEEIKEQLNEITKSEEVVQGIYDAAKNSMGQDITENDKVRK